MLWRSGCQWLTLLTLACHAKGAPTASRAPIFVSSLLGTQGKTFAFEQQHQEATPSADAAAHAGISNVEIKDESHLYGKPLTSSAAQRASGNKRLPGKGRRKMNQGALLPTKEQFFIQVEPRSKINTDDDLEKTEMKADLNEIGKQGVPDTGTASLPAPSHLQLGVTQIFDQLLTGMMGTGLNALRGGAMAAPTQQPALAAAAAPGVVQPFGAAAAPMYYQPEQQGLSTMEIILIISGCILFVGLIGLLICLLTTKKRRRR